MYSPGPVNLLAFNDALKGHRRSIAGYCLGVGLAMLTSFLILGFVGSTIVGPALLRWLTFIGSAYILYLALRLWTAGPSVASDTVGQPMSWRNGYCLQLLNPKGLIVVLPVTTVMFPTANIHGVTIVGVSILISLGAIGAPAVYALGGFWIGQRFAHPRIFTLFNRIVALLLVSVVVSLLYDFFVCGTIAGSHI